MPKRSVDGHGAPAAVQLFVHRRIVGDGPAEEGAKPYTFKGHSAQCIEALEAVKEASEEIATYLDCMEGRAVLESDPYLESLTEEKERQNKIAKHHSEEIESLQRLADVGYMGDVLSLLGFEFTKDEQWDAYLSAALDARVDFGEYRGLGKQAREIANDISQSSIALVNLIRGLRNTGSNLPDILMPRTKEGDIIDTSGPPAVARAKLRRWILHYYSDERRGRESETDIVSTLLELSKLMKQFKPDFMDVGIEFGINTRQHSKKTSYIRAFAANLKDRGFDISTRMKKSMAITANVIFNDRNVDVTEDDVRKALSGRRPCALPPEGGSQRARSRKTRSENPG